MTTLDAYNIISTYDPAKILAAGIMPQGIAMGDIYREQSRLFALLTPAERRQDEKSVRIALGRIASTSRAASHR